MVDVDAISSDVIGEAIAIHRELGPGLLENAYELTLAAALRRRGYHVDTQVPVAIRYQDLEIKAAFRVDILIEGSLVVEVKAIDQLTKLHARQVLTYLRLMKQPLGLLLNFSGLTMKEGIRRLVNDHRPGA